MRASELAEILLQDPDKRVVVHHGDARSMHTVACSPDASSVVVYGDQIRINVARQDK